MPRYRLEKRKRRNVRLTRRERRALAMFFVSAATVLVILSLAIALRAIRRGQSGGDRPLATRAEVRDGEVAFPLEMLRPGSAQFVEAALPMGEKVRFVVAQRKAGDAIAVVDGCTPCGSGGHQLRGDALVCIECREEFTLASLGTGSSGQHDCEPATLPSRRFGPELRVDIRKVPGPK